MKQSEWLIVQKIQNMESQWYLERENDWDGAMRWEKNKAEIEGKDLGAAMKTTFETTLNL